VDVQMTNRRSTGNARTGENGHPAGAGSAGRPGTHSSTPSDVNGKLALLLAGFAFAAAAFLILLVALAASNA
jgi:hypothetical protein